MTAVVVVVLDLSDPATVISSALHWLSLVQQKLAATFGLFEKRGLQQLPQQLRTRQRNKVLGQQHADAQLVNCPGG
jgi:dynein light intermediate chain 2